jgi:hypothetical protein
VGSSQKVGFRHRGRDGRLPACYACRKDGIYDRSARITQAAVRAEVPFEPYALSLCDHHLVQLLHELPEGSVRVTQRYGPARPD